MKIYIACGLTHVPRRHFLEYTEFVHQLADHLGSNEGHEIKYALVDSDPQLEDKPISERARLCYHWDTEMVREADVVIAECSFPAIGLGIELQHAAENDIPVVMAFRDFGSNKAKPIAYSIPDSTTHDLQIGEGYISLMALGLPTLFKVHQYSTNENGITSINESIKTLQC